MTPEVVKTKPHRPEGCDCESCDHETGKGVGGFCPSCASFHIAVLRHTVAAFKGEWHMPELAHAGGFRRTQEGK